MGWIERERERERERKGSEIRKEELTGANGESTSVSGWRSWQAGDTKELTAVITMGHYGHSAVGHYINGPPLSTISPTGQSGLLSSRQLFFFFLANCIGPLAHRPHKTSR